MSKTDREQQTVIVERHNEILVVSLNRPEVRNAVDSPTARQLAAAFIDFERDETLKVAVLTGSGGHFCAGADLKAIGAEAFANLPVLSADSDPFNVSGPMGPSYLQLSKPVIAAVEGYAVAGGLELACWCDLRVVTDDAIFGVFCRRWGVPLIDGGTVRLPRLIGHSRAMDMVLTGRPVGAREAEQFGLANRIVESGRALPAAIELAEQLAAFPQTCLRNDRLSLLQQWGMSGVEALANENRLGRETFASGETTAGAQKFSLGAGRQGKFSENE
ncbi:MAG: crotonase/enoyl-CoA hydratase family protein [Porticoccaceae bacterium]